MWFRASLVAVAVVCFLCAVSRGQPYNGDFEIPDESRPNTYYYDPNVFPPLGWDWLDTFDNKNYVALRTEFTPPIRDYWTIPNSFEAESFVLLSSGDAEGPYSDGATEYSSIKQIISVNPGDVLYGSYFFGTCDYGPWDDRGIIKAIPVDPNNFVDPNEIEIVFTSVNILGSFQSTDGWQNFQWTFEEGGEYLLY